MNKTSLLACFCLCFACFASAQDIQDRCRTATSQTELNRCWSQAAADSERNLSKAYIKTLARVQDPKNPGVASMFKQAQSRWTAYRKVQCDVVGKLYEGASMERMQRDACRAQLAEQRIQVLKSLLPE